MKALTAERSSYGYLFLHALLKREGLVINKKRTYHDKSRWTSQGSDRHDQNSPMIKIDAGSHFLHLIGTSGSDDSERRP